MGDAHGSAPPRRPGNAPRAVASVRAEAAGLTPRHVTRSRLARLLGAEAVTLGSTVYWARDVVPSFVAHELEHVRQFREHGWVRFLARYVADYLAGRLRGLSHRDAYLAIRFEREARAAETPRP